MTVLKLPPKNMKTRGKIKDEKDTISNSNFFLFILILIILHAKNMNEKCVKAESTFGTQRIRTKQTPRFICMHDIRIIGEYFRE